MGTKQKGLRKRRAQTAIQVPYLDGGNTNYLLKMKADTLEFSRLSIKDHFNFGESRGDPFLIQLSLSGAVAQGDIRALKQRKEQASKKQVLPLTQDEVTKAKACEEMIMFEKQPVPGSTLAPAPDVLIVDSFSTELRNRKESIERELNGIRSSPEGSI